MKKYLPLLILALLLGLFFFSSQDSIETNAISLKAAHAAARLLYFNFEHCTPEIQSALIHGLNPFIRKAAHLTLYALLGGLSYLWLRHLPHNISTAMSIAALFAALDEFHQLFVDGRTGNVTDIFLDCFGAACGIGIVFLLLCLRHCLHNAKIQKKGVWNKCQRS